MRLARKLTLSLVLGILFVVAMFDYRLVEDDIHSVETHIADDLALMARGLAVALPELVRSAGSASAERLIAERNSDESSARVRWVRLDAPAGDASAVELSPARLMTLAATGELRLTRGKRSAAERLVVYRAFAGESPIRNLVEVSKSLLPVRRQERRSLIAIIVKSLFIVVAGSAFALALGFRVIGQPVRLLVTQARRIGAGDLSLRLVFPHRRDELTELAAEMNQMSDRLVEARDRLVVESAAKVAAVEQLRHADRLKTVGQLASGIAHELGTPLNVVSGHAKMIASGRSEGDEALSGARIIVEQTARITTIIRQLLDFARRSQPTLAVGDLDDVVERTVRMLAHLAVQRNLQLRFQRPGGPAPVEMDEGQVQQAVTNVLMNAIQSMSGGGEIVVERQRQRATPPEGPGRDGGYQCITIRDHGSGMTADVLGRVFEPFFTTKSVGEGTGLGLSVSHGIVQQHGGWIAAASEPGHGSTFSIFLPAVDA